MQILKLFMLLSNDLLILELEQLSLLLKVGNDLSQTFLEKFNLGFEQFNLFVLFKLFLGMLLHRHTLLFQVILSLVIV